MHIFPKFSLDLYLFDLTETLVAYIKGTRCFPFTGGAPDGQSLHRFSGGQLSAHTLRIRIYFNCREQIQGSIYWALLCWAQCWVLSVHWLIYYIIS